MTTVARPSPPIATQLQRLAVIGVAIGSLVGVPSAFRMLFSEPAQAVIAERPAAQIIDRSPDGLFHARIAVHGQTIDCLVDTGATSLTLSSRTARRLGMPSSAPLTIGRVTTAGGSVRADRTTLDDVTLAGRHFADVPTVLIHGATPCLIGHDLLGRLQAVELRGGRLHLS